MLFRRREKHAHNILMGVYTVNSGNQEGEQRSTYCVVNNGIPPLILTTGRSLYHFHTGTMTRKVTVLNVLKPEGVVEISPKDASQLGIVEGDKVKVSSRRAEVTTKAKVTEALSPGVVFLAFHFAESAANILTNTKLDPVSKISELKVSAVRVEKL
jgi:anaerobic selenocysteine-containing dehydrogenase